METPIRTGEATPCWEAIHQDPPEWLIPGWLRRESLTLLSAPGGTGKSQLTTALAFALTDSRGFLGEPPINWDQPSALLFAADPPAWDTNYVIARVAKGMGISPESDQSGGGSPQFWIDYEKFDIFKYPTLEKLSARFPTIGFTEDGSDITLDPDLLIFDALRSYHTGEENESSHCSQLMAIFRAYANAGATVLLVHHESKGALTTGRPKIENARGSGVLTDVPDNYVSLTAEKESGGQIITAHWAKGRGPDIPPSLSYRVQWSHDTITFHPWTDEDQTTAAITKKEELITTLPDNTVWADVLHHLSMSSGNAKALLAEHGWTKDTNKRWRKPPPQ